MPERYEPPKFEWVIKDGKQQYCVTNADSVNPDRLAQAHKTAAMLGTCCPPPSRANGGSPLFDCEQGTAMEKLATFLEKTVKDGYQYCGKRREDK